MNANYLTYKRIGWGGLKVLGGTVQTATKLSCGGVNKIELGGVKINLQL